MLATVATYVMALLIGQLPATAGGVHPFSGHWVADIAASRFNGAIAVKSTTLDIRADAKAVVITSRTIDVDDRDLVTGPTVFETDGEPHPHDELMRGLVVVCRWTGPTLLDTVLTRPNGIVDHVTYELSPTQRRLTVKTAGPLGTQEVVFGRE